MKKKVSINTSMNTILEFDSLDYDRAQIDSTIYQRAYGKVSNTEWIHIQKELYFYKLLDMPLHISNV